MKIIAHNQKDCKDPKTQEAVVCANAAVVPGYEEGGTPRCVLVQRVAERKSEELTDIIQDYVLAKKRGGYRHSHYLSVFAGIMQLRRLDIRGWHAMPLTWGEYEVKTALQAAAMAGRVEAVKALLAARPSDSKYYKKCKEHALTSPSLVAFLQNLSRGGSWTAQME
jgi:hypothetical protein